VRAGASEPLTALLHIGTEEQRDKVACTFMRLTDCDAELKAALASEGLGAVLANLARKGPQWQACLARKGLRSLAAGGPATVSRLHAAGVFDLAADPVSPPTSGARARKSTESKTCARRGEKPARRRAGAGGRWGGGRHCRCGAIRARPQTSTGAVPSTA
jgi:hypothetical protein